VSTWQTDVSTGGRPPVVSGCHGCPNEAPSAYPRHLVVLGIVLIVLGRLVATLNVVLIIGVILLVVGPILNFVPIGGTRRRYY
jgi:hypothetical protein